MDVASFRSTWPVQTLSHAGTEWEYLRSEAGDRTLLILPGALALAESTWATFAWFADPDHLPPLDVISISYPPEIDTVTKLVDGISGMLDALGVQDLTVLGSSYGSMIAQMLARRHPTQVARMILSHASPSVPERAASVQRSMKLWRRLPVPILKSMYRRQFARSFTTMGDDAAREMTDYMETVVSKSMTRDSIINTFLRVADYDQHWNDQPNTPYPGPVRLLYAELDPVTPEDVRAQMKEIYPQAEMVVFAGSNYADALAHPEPYLAAADELIAASGH